MGELWFWEFLKLYLRNDGKYGKFFCLFIDVIRRKGSGFYFDSKEDSMLVRDLTTDVSASTDNTKFIVKI